MAVERNVRRKCYTSIYNWHSFGPEIICNYGKGKIKFKGICLKQDSVACSHKTVVNLHISYELKTWSRDLNLNFTLGNCLFGSISQLKMLILINMDIVVMVLDMIHNFHHNFHHHKKTRLKTLLFFGLI